MDLNKILLQVKKIQITHLKKRMTRLESEMDLMTLPNLKMLNMPKKINLQIKKSIILKHWNKTIKNTWKKCQLQILSPKSKTPKLMLRRIDRIGHKKFKHPLSRKMMISQFQLLTVRNSYQIGRLNPMFQWFQIRNIKKMELTPNQEEEIRSLRKTINPPNKKRFSSLETIKRTSPTSKFQVNRWTIWAIAISKMMM